MNSSSEEPVQPRVHRRHHRRHRRGRRALLIGLLAGLAASFLFAGLLWWMNQGSLKSRQGSSSRPAPHQRFGAGR